MLSSLFNLSCVPLSGDWASLLIRWAVGIALLPWGIKKLMHPEGAAQFPQVMFFSSKIGYYCTMLIEILVPLCLMGGFLTRFAVIPAICSFAVATKVSWGEYGTSPALPFLLSLIAIFFIGSGIYSLDFLILRHLLGAY